ncbi:hypothetical protein PHMEG_00028319 [Phytophthora megakarya]|uniref:Uncharacterized protein n=1 Tax=Phytophthora megakarya TaxID=4795 RepID=A0A225V4T4_9STRA|nr:hypothetical protein PHMEG_00028319 [Phytophthora megakarya]
MFENHHRGTVLAWRVYRLVPAATALSRCGFRWESCLSFRIWRATAHPSSSQVANDDGSFISRYGRGASAPVPAHAPVGVPSGSTADAVQGSLDHARALVALGNPPLAALSAEDRALREALLVPTYSLTGDIRGSFIDVVWPERTAPELAGSLGFRDTGVSLPLGGTATPDLVALAGPAQLPPSFVYLPAATEDIRALAAGNPSGLRFRDVEGLIHVGVRVPELTVTQLEALSNLVLDDDRMPADILVPEHLSETSSSVAPGQRARASEVQAGPLLDVFGSSRFGYRVLNTLHALRLALDRLRLLETARDLAANADPRSEVANAILRHVLEREVTLRETRDQEWETALREVDSTTVTSYQGFCRRVQAILQSEVQRGSALVSRLELTEARYLDAERALTDHDAEVRRLSKRIRKLRVSNQDLRTERRRFRALFDPGNLVRYFNNQGSPAVMTGASEFQEQLTAYCRSEQPPCSVFLMVSKNNAPPPPFQAAQVESDSEGSDPASDAESGDGAGGGAGNKPVGGDPAGSNPASAPSTHPQQSSAQHSGPAKTAMAPGEDPLPASGSKETKSTPPPSSQGNSLLRPVPGASEANLLGHLFDADYDMGGDDIEEERQTPLDEKQEEDHPMGEEPGEQDLPGSEDVELQGVSGSGPRMSADGLRQVRPAVYDPQTDPKGGSYRPIDSDADPVRPVVELAHVLTRSKVEDVRMDVLEYWQMDADRCNPN